MLKKFLVFTSISAIFSMVFALPITVLAQTFDMPPSGGSMTGPTSGGTMMPPPDSSMMGTQPMIGTQQPIMGTQPMMGPGNFSSGPMTGPGSGSFGPGGEGGMMGPGSFGTNGQMGPGGMGPTGEGMMGPGGTMGPGNQGMGPSEEQMEKMQQQREEMEKKMRGRGLQQMQRGIKQFARGLAMVEKRIAQLEKQNVPVPADLKEKIAQVKAAVDAILAAQDPEEVMDQLQTVQEMGESMGELMPRLEMLARLPQMIKKATQEITRLEKTYKRDAAKAERSGIDVSSILSKWQALIDELKAVLADAKSGNFPEGEDLMQAIGEGVFERLEEGWRYHQTIEMVLNIKRNLKQVAAALKRYEKKIAQLERKDVDMTEARSVLEELKAKYNEVSQAVVGGLEPEELEEVLSNLDYYMQLQEQLEELLNLGGPSLFEKELKATPSKGGAMPKLQIPDFEKLMRRYKLNTGVAQR